MTVIEPYVICAGSLLISVIVWWCSKRVYGQDVDKSIMSDCENLFNLPKRTIQEWVRDASSDETIIMLALHKTPVILVSSSPVGRTVLLEMYCKGLLVRAEFTDGDIAYKMADAAASEFAQVLRDTASYD